MRPCSQSKLKEEAETLESLILPFTGFVKIGDPQPYASSALFKENRRRLIEDLNKILTNKSLIILQGGSKLHIYDTGKTYDFVQESFFYWLSGVIQADCFYSLDLTSGQCVLFVPNTDEYNEDYRLQIKKLYDVDLVLSVNEINNVILISQAECILTLKGINPLTGLKISETNFENKYSIPIDKEILYPSMIYLRTIKSKEEISVLQLCGLLVGEALKYIMLRVRPSVYEFQTLAMFKHFCNYTAGCLLPTINGICASGTNLQILNYSGPMYKLIANGDMCMLDFGTAYCGYRTNGVVTFPANGNFNWKQKDIYLIVERIWKNILGILKAGINSVKLQVFAHETMLRQLLRLRILQGQLLEMLEAGVSAVFAPNSLIQFIGIDYVDVGGYIENVTPSRPTETWLSNINTARVLREHMVITFRPQCMFIKELIQNAYNDENLGKFIDKERLEVFMEVGGVTFEDTILITNEGYELLTNIPRTFHDINCFLKLSVNKYLNNILDENLFKKDIIMSKKMSKKRPKKADP